MTRRVFFRALLAILAFAPIVAADAQTGAQNEKRYQVTVSGMT
jgi:hypothetical protein